MDSVPAKNQEAESLFLQPHVDVPMVRETVAAAAAADGGHNSEVMYTPGSVPPFSFLLSHPVAHSFPPFDDDDLGALPPIVYEPVYEPNAPLPSQGTINGGRKRMDDEFMATAEAEHPNAPFIYQ